MNGEAVESRSCTDPAVTSRLLWLCIPRRSDGWVYLLSCHLAMLTQSAPALAATEAGVEGWEMGSKWTWSCLSPGS